MYIKNKRLKASRDGRSREEMLINAYKKQVFEIPKLLVIWHVRQLRLYLASVESSDDELDSDNTVA